MVAIFHEGKTLSKAISYNEHKVKNGQAVAIMASGYTKDLSKLSFRDKLFQLQQLTTLNKRTQSNAIHVSLNFDPSEELSSDRMQEIASAYMIGIGFGAQPYLVYRHVDAGHPHLHIVSTNIRRDGSRIPLHNIGRNQSEKTRKEIEKEFGLVQANSKPKEQYRLKPIEVKAVLYGKTETKKAISDIVREVVSTYKFTSIPELNAVLRQYNIMADRGTEGSLIYRKGGLQYRLIDSKGNKRGVPIKASTLSSKPILKILEKKFIANAILRKPFKETVRNSIRSVLSQNKNLDMQQLEEELKAKKIGIVFRLNEQGRLYGITYIDAQSKSVFKGSDLGKEYSANAIADRLNTRSADAATPVGPGKTIGDGSDKTKLSGGHLEKNTLLHELLKPENQTDNNSVPVPFRLNRKKKRRPNKGPQL